MTLPTRRRRALGIATVVATGLAVLAAADPFHLLLAPWYVGVLVTVTIVLATVWLAGLLRRRAMRVLLVVAGVVLVLGWSAFVWLLAQLRGPERVVGETAAGDYRLVTVQGAVFAADPIYAVRLRTGSGPFAQDALVWQGLRNGAPPADIRFHGDDEVEVVARGGCGYRSHVDRLTLAVDPVHRPLRLDSC
ncbi:hypothetical protein [Pseudonocardia acidicola]|uniref:DUF4131 domain-containing protein n=1 Tax=Pseudonocardia acidicola TaxID=2724939 RepID=A0ABX1SDB0_9PSEU|nr:hypothetical protein [Pseudonocardia acidicola]NMH98478.1 hypothetical protein [Pseudonocardia acidicola]